VHLTELLGTDLHAGVEEILARHGAARPAPGADDEADMRHALHWLLRMAETTHRRASTPAAPVDPVVLARFEALLAERPPRDVEHAQLHIDAASSLRRAQVVRAHAVKHPGAVLAVGDDDAVTLALALLGQRELFAVDIDPRILAFLSRAAREIGAHIEVAEVDVLGAPLPSSLRRRCTAVLTDPIRDMDATIGFLLFGAAALSREVPSRLYWADHPDWSFEHGEVVAALERAGLHVAEVHEDLHAYPLEPGVIDLDRIARELAIDAAWLKNVASLTRAWSHLYALERR
jgi:hypothetical protein